MFANGRNHVLFQIGDNRGVHMNYDDGFMDDLLSTERESCRLGAIQGVFMLVVMKFT